MASSRNVRKIRIAISPRLATRTFSNTAGLEGDVPVLAPGLGLALGLRGPERLDQDGPGAARLDHVVDVAAFGGDVRVREPLAIVVDELLAALGVVAGLGELGAERSE